MRTQQNDFPGEPQEVLPRSEDAARRHAQVALAVLSRRLAVYATGLADLLIERGILTAEELDRAAHEVEVRHALNEAFPTAAPRAEEDDTWLAGEEG